MHAALWLTVLLVTGRPSLPRPTSSNVVLTLEELNVSSQLRSAYVGRYGVSISNASVVDYSTYGMAGFARSGVKGAELCYSQELCTAPLDVTFTAPQSFVRLWIGTTRGTNRPNQPRDVQLQAFDASGNVVASASYTFPLSGAALPIASPISVSTATPQIRRITLGYAPPGPLAFNAGLAFDNLEFDAPGTPPPCPATVPPTISLLQPAMPLTVSKNELLLALQANSQDPYAQVQVTATVPSGASRSDTLPLNPGGRYGPIWEDGLLLPGLNTVTALITDCAGMAKSTSPVITYQTAGSWSQVIPTSIPIPNGDAPSGEVDAIAVDPRDANVAYLGAAEGGVWGTWNGGQSWRPLSDGLLVRTTPGASSGWVGTSSVDALVLDPARPGTIYAGTGDQVAAGPKVSVGLGVFKSTDGGASWSPLGSKADAACGVGSRNGAVASAGVYQLVLATNPTRLFAATRAGLFVYPEDGSDCWSAAPGVPVAAALDLAADPSGTRLYVALAGVGVYRSLNGGLGWTASPTLPAGPAVTSAALAVAPSNPTTAYASFVFASGPAIYATTDGGARWSLLPQPPNEPILGGANTLAIHPARPDTVYFGLTSLWRTTDGGRTGGMNSYSLTSPVVSNRSWTTLSCCRGEPNPARAGIDLHADIRKIAFAPSNSSIVYVANDGGVTRGVVDPLGRVTWRQATGGLAVGQVSALTISPLDDDEISLGIWHVGTIYGSVSAGVAFSLRGGDGWGGFVDANTNPVTSTIHFKCNAGFGSDLCRARFNRQTRLSSLAPSALWKTLKPDNMTKVDPTRPGNLFVAFLRNAMPSAAVPASAFGHLFRATGADTSAIQDASPTGPLDTLAGWQDITPPGATGDVSALAFAPGAAAVPIYWVGTTQGEVFRGSPENGWSRVPCAGCTGQINDIGVDVSTTGRAAVVAGSPGMGKVWELKLAPGGTWSATDVSRGFAPSTRLGQLNRVAIDPLNPTSIYVGTDQGMYRAGATATGWQWARMPGIPDVWVTEIAVHLNASGSSGTVRAATYGRGIFELQRGSGPVGAPAKVALRSSRAASPPPASATLHVRAGGQARVQVIVRGGRLEHPSAGDAPFDLALPSGGKVILDAPPELGHGDALLRPAGWSVNGGPLVPGNEILVSLHGDTTATIHYAPADQVPSTLRVHALHVGTDGSPVELPVPIAVKVGDAPGAAQEPPFDSEIPAHSSLSLAAPETFTARGEVLRFSGWVLNGKTGHGVREIPVHAWEAAEAVVLYRTEVGAGVPEHGQDRPHPPHHESRGPGDHH